jgi:hypothetical protein
MVRDARIDRFDSALKFTDQFFMSNSPVHKALVAISKTLDEEGIPYAIAGAMALNEYGFIRATTDVDVILTREGLARLKERVLGRGYVEKFPGSKGLRDTENGVLIDFLLAGEYPGDGKPKSVQIPDPARVAERRGPYSFVPLAMLVELKLASGISAGHRLKDLGDVQELIKHASLPRDLGDQLDPYVRAKYFEIWDAAQVRDPE